MSFRLVSRVVIAKFWRAKISFSLVKNSVFPRLQNMELVWTQKWCKIFYLKLNRNISWGSNMLAQLRSYEPPKWASLLKHIPQFFVQVSSFDITSSLFLLCPPPLWSSLFSVEGKMCLVFNMSSVSGTLGTRSKCRCFASPCTVKLITS